MSRREFWTVFVEEVRRGSGRTWYRVATLAAPVILIVLLVAVPLIRSVIVDEGEDARVRIGIVDNTGVVSPEVVADAGMELYDDRKTATDALVAEDMSLYM